MRDLKSLEREGHSRTAAAAAGTVSMPDPYEQAVAYLQLLEKPATDLQRSALRQVIELATRLLDQPTPNTETAAA